MDNTQTLLGILGTGPSYGYDVKRSYDRYFGSKKPMAFGQVYATLARLLRDGLIAMLGEETGSGPDRKRYEITEVGRKRVSEWMFTPDVPEAQLQSNLFAKTVIALLLEDDAEGLLDIQRGEHMARLRELTSAKRGANVMEVLMCDHAMFHIEADLRWIDLTAARLTELRAQVTGA
ncbi:PadR family transcriptional regulator [Alpinimonas psychrophila]|uniref:DNA-binding PadR family transcriptional regulator n=1 Tax=Alpinimonas psychrophila TaxID=748908 RepID=A0A7W3PNZ0_9MICO|nr:PadR family transcriptional regulator [Alpinimonas psychrophila]MBA8828693.1 DNA-binding PadR family transcriptional regulator [Alpinimonas psychrophila]